MIGNIIDSFSKKNQLVQLEQRAKRVRLRVLELTSSKSTLHVGSSLSVVEILISIFSLTGSAEHILMGKGQGAPAFWAACAEFGFVSDNELKKFATPGSVYAPALSDYKSLSLGYSSAILGNTLSIAAGKAYAGKTAFFVVIGDKEFDQGNTLEAFQAIPKLQINSLVLVVDNNVSSKEQRFEKVHKYGDMLKSFGWQTKTVNGHKFRDLISSFKNTSTTRPTCIFANTNYGQGVSFLVSKDASRFRPLTHTEYKIAVNEIGV